MAKCQGCGSGGWGISLKDGLCPECYEKQQAERAATVRLRRSTGAQFDPAKILLTTETAPSLPIAERLEIITAECVLGMNVFKDVSSLVRDVVGGRSEAYQEELRKARKTVLAELKREAFELGADAVVAVTLNYSEISGGGKSMLFLVAAGTAVRMEKPTSLD